MTYLWVIPVVLLLVLAVWIFYYTIKQKGGSGVRKPGRTVHDEHESESQG